VPSADQEGLMMSRQMTNELQQCIDLCEQGHRCCEETVTRCMEMGGDQMRRIGMMIMSCADCCRMSADMMTRCWGAGGDAEICAVSMKVLEMCAELCEASSDLCRKTDDAQLKECAEILNQCAEMCHKMTPRAMQSA
jgi:hypothetical protein